MKYVLLDYDGFIAKAYYASKSKDNEDKDSPIDIILELDHEAYCKGRDYFNEDVKVLRIVSGHTYKKDIFPGYKGKRKRDDELGEFRDYIKENFDVIIAENLEADDYLTLFNDFKNQECLVISDDKDLRYYNTLVSRINPGDPIVLQDESVMGENKLIQMVAGDSIDCIKGIPRKGEVWARKYLDKNGYSIESVIKAYREVRIDIDECLKNLVEVIPLCLDYLPEYDVSHYFNTLRPDIKKLCTMEMIEKFIRNISDKIKEIYYNDSESKKDNEKGT